MEIVCAVLEDKAFKYLLDFIVYKYRWIKNKFIQNLPSQTARKMSIFLSYVN